MPMPHHTMTAKRVKNTKLPHIEPSNRDCLSGLHRRDALLVGFQNLPGRLAAFRSKRRVELQTGPAWLHFAWTLGLGSFNAGNGKILSPVGASLSVSQTSCAFAPGPKP